MFQYDPMGEEVAADTSEETGSDERSEVSSFFQSAP